MLSPSLSGQQAPEASILFQLAVEAQLPQYVLLWLWLWLLQMRCSYMRSHKTALQSAA
jgi:hypothetical protein